MWSPVRPQHATQTATFPKKKKKKPQEVEEQQMKSFTFISSAGKAFWEGRRLRTGVQNIKTTQLLSK